MAAEAPRPFRDLSPPIYFYRSQANGFDGKSDGKILLSVLFRNFTVKPIRGTQETIQITEQSVYRYTGKFQEKYIGNSYNREPAPVLHLLIDALLITALVRPTRRIVEPN